MGRGGVTCWSFGTDVRPDISKSTLFMYLGSEIRDPFIYSSFKNTTYTNEPGHEKMCLMSYANNKGADQPAHPRSLISAFVVRCLDSIISLDSIAEISRL